MICPRDAARLDFCAGLKVAGMRGPFLCTSDLVPRSRVFKQKAMPVKRQSLENDAIRCLSQKHFSFRGPVGGDRRSCRQSPSIWTPTSKLHEKCFWDKHRIASLSRLCLLTGIAFCLKTRERGTRGSLVHRNGPRSPATFRPAQKSRRAASLGQIIFVQVDNHSIWPQMRNAERGNEF